MNVSTRRTVLVAVCAAVALAVAALVRPAPSTLPRTGAGDPELAALAREVVGPGRPALAVAAVTADSTRTAVLGAAPTPASRSGRSRRASPACSSPTWSRGAR
jgi:hypothetical protein